jgi:hypothetical protein
VGDDTVLSFNVEGANAAEMTVLLEGVTATRLTAGDFIL